MALKIRFRFDGKCGRHPRYDPKRDGQPQHGNCEGCESLYTIHLYVKIARSRADKAEGISVRTPSSPGEQLGSGEAEPVSDSNDQ